MKLSASVRRLCLGATLLLAAAGFVSSGPSRAEAATPLHTDVMFLFDTTGSMGGALTAASAEIQAGMTQIAASLPDAQFGLAEVSDYKEVNNPGFFDYDIGGSHDPWTLKVPITSNQSAISEQLAKLVASGGGDSPEAYGRGLYESASNAGVGWRPGARGLIVLVADDVPHDNELNLGIPTESWVESPFDTGIDPGADNTVGSGDDLDWQGVLQRLITDGKPLEFVDYQGDPEYLPYWKIWAGSTGGAAFSAESGNLVTQIVEAVKAGASAALPPCPAGQIRDATEHCVTPLPPAPPSNNFKIELRISCSKGCHVVEVKVVFDSAGNVIAESVLGETAGASGAQISASPKGKKACGKSKAGCKPKPLIKRLTQAVVPGANTLKLKLTGAALKKLHKKGKVNLKVGFTFTPTGGAPKTTVQTLKVKLPKGKTKQGPKKKGGK